MAVTSMSRSSIRTFEKYRNISAGVPTYSAEYLVIAGGGAGGGYSNSWSGGGGAGGYL